jgi:hypothetical protein
MKKGFFLLISLVLVLVAAYFIRARADESVELDACDPSQISQTIAPFNSMLQSFDDKSMIAFNVPRDLVIEPTMRMQDVRRDLANLDTPECLQSLKGQMLKYMDSILNVLVAFIGGAGPEQTRAGLEVAQPLRLSLEAELADLLGATLTPYPTAARQAQIPVSGNTDETAELIAPTATAEHLLATVRNSTGANLRFGPSLNYSFTYVLDAGTVVELLGISDDGQWIFVNVPDIENGQGWLYASLIESQTSYDLLPVLTITPLP